MPSDESADEATFTDCVASGTELQSESDTPAGRRRQLSVSEMVRRAETRKQKRSAPDRSSKSPRDHAPPAAKRPLTGPAEPAGPPGVELSAGALAAIQQLVENGQSAVISAFELKFERMERRLNVLESELMDKELEVQKINEQLMLQTQANAELRAQVESIDLNRRLSSLILTCDDFAQRSQNENIEEKVTLVLNERIPALNLTVTEIHVAHRLQRDDKVIVKFSKRSTRDRIYDARFGLTSYSAGAAVVRLGAGGAADTRGRRRLAPLFITESLTAHNQRIYNQLLQVRKSSGGIMIASVFSRRGLVFCRTFRNGPNIRVPDEAALRRIIGEAAPAPYPPSSGARARAADASPGGRAGRPGAPAPSARGGDGVPRSVSSPPGGESVAPAAAAVAASLRTHVSSQPAAVVQGEAGGAGSSGGAALGPPVSTAAQRASLAWATPASGGPSSAAATVAPSAEAAGAHSAAVDAASLAAATGTTSADVAVAPPASGAVTPSAAAARSTGAPPSEMSRPPGDASRW